MLKNLMVYDSETEYRALKVKDRNGDRYDTVKTLFARFNTHFISKNVPTPSPTDSTQTSPEQSHSNDSVAGAIDSLSGSDNSRNSSVTSSEDEEYKKSPPFA
jgi:hypothetical protein